MRQRVVPVSGDLCLKDLGLKPEVRQLLIDDLDVIISGAASIYFTDPV